MDGAASAGGAACVAPGAGSAARSGEASPRGGRMNGHHARDFAAKYAAFLSAKAQDGTAHGFAPLWMPDFLFDFQAALVEWAIQKGRAAIFADCGLGKTPMQLVWAENIVRKTNRPVLIATPLAVSYQVLQEAEKFGIDCERSVDGTVRPGARIVVTNYERLDH